MRLLPLMLLLAAQFPAAGQTNIPARQSLSYNIEWRLITAGKARLEWAARGPRDGYEVKFHIQSVGLVSKLFKVEDDYSALLNSALCTQSFHSTTNEGIRHRDTRVTFDSETKKGSYL